jgi:dTDP-4-dehydrorhamnose 3,5-epimerase
MDKPELIRGNVHEDSRGKLFFNNLADMSAVKRLYFIEHPNIQVIRAWQAHKIEQKWFQVILGKFEISLINVNWENPEDSLPAIRYVLDATQSEILHVPGGYASGFRALENNSKIMVCSDFTLEESKGDDFRFPIEQWDLDN